VGKLSLGDSQATMRRGLCGQGTFIIGTNTTVGNVAPQQPWLSSPTMS
jgi:hypothetical protein